MTLHRISRKIPWVFGILALALVIALTMASAGQTHADNDPFDCSKNGLKLGLTVTPPGAVVDGDVITYEVAIDNVGATNCRTTEVDVDLHLPNGSTVSVLAGADIGCPWNAFGWLILVYTSGTIQ